MTATVLRGDARHLPLPDASVDLICTSPPYFGLRSYTDGGAHYPGQIGSEATPQEWLAALVECTREWVRVLKPEGSLFVNLGDKYSTVGGGPPGPTSGIGVQRGGRNQHLVSTKQAFVTEARPKSLLGLPWRYALAATDQLGLILRRDIIWSKANGLPESVRDRCRSSHEYIFHLTKQPHYYSAIDEIRLPADTPRRALRAASGPVAHGQEVSATVFTGDDVLTVQGICNLGTLGGPVEAPMAGNAQGLQVVEPVGFSLRIEVGERAYVADLKPRRLTAALDAPMPVALKDTLAQLLPAGTAPSAIPATPSGILLAGSVVPDAWRRAEITRLECALCPPEGLAARLTLDLHPGRATLLVWNSFGTAHENSLPNGNTALGKLPGSVWEIPSQPLITPDYLPSHFAAFPMELPRRIIQGWSPAGVCTGCGQGRRPVSQPEVIPHWKGGTKGARNGARTGRALEPRTNTLHAITGYAWGCSLDVSRPGSEDNLAYAQAGPGRQPTRPAVVLDPFGGTGTTALVADALGRHGISVDMSADYSRLAKWRCSDPGERARALEVPKPPPVHENQDTLFDLAR